ncbi:hypothetical protein FN846DRAFT_922967 [Sphaerosporella brunnea]|uniref:BTB domain-containing protein n=1 Tax=Sphaerosporella brunnea TaxID=1250544 RepID=A0A5J5EGM8_9PEZI|nr:hypothetical protein FN846DRAFT_922967 [Sphaerosporella brunnea]
MPSHTENDEGNEYINDINEYIDDGHKADSDEDDSGKDGSGFKVMKLTKMVAVNAIVFSRSSAPCDVEISIGTDVYHLHRVILCEYSLFFDKSLSETWWREKNTHHGLDGIKYRYHLVLDKDDLVLSMVEPVPADQVDATEMVQVPEKLRAAYADLFKVFYKQACSIEYQGLGPIQDLVNLADQYMCLKSVAFVLESMVLKWMLFSGAANLPDDSPELLLLAKKIRSKELFNDAFVHVVGLVNERPDRIKTVSPELQQMVCDVQMDLAKKQSVVDRYLAWWLLETPVPDVALALKEHCHQGAGTLYSKLYHLLRNCAMFDKGTEAGKCLGELVEKTLLWDLAEYPHLTCARCPDYPWSSEGEW